MVMPKPEGVDRQALRAAGCLEGGNGLSTLGAIKGLPIGQEHNKVAGIRSAQHALVNGREDRGEARATAHLHTVNLQGG